jgi:diguanylate cyclase (GGDEF)-like protein/PAS domain S-box-containing protein
VVNIRRVSLNIKIAATVSILFICTYAIIAYGSICYFENEFRKSIFQQQFAMVTSLADDIEGKLRLTHNALLAALQQFPTASINDPDRVQRFLDSNTPLLAIFDNALFLFSKEGRIIAESPYIAGRRGRDISFREYFQKTIASRRPHISDPYLSTHNPGHPSIMLTAPILDANGNVMAILAGSFDLLGENFLAQLADEKIGETGYLYLIDGKRNLIMHPDRARIMKQDIQPGTNILLDKAIEGFQGSGETINSKGVHLLTSFKRLNQTDWILAVNYPENEAYAPLKRARLYYILAISCGTVLVLIFAWKLMQLLTKPLLAITEHVESLPDKPGERGMIAIDSCDEIGTLATAFNKMMCKIDHQQEVLRESEINFRAMADNANDGMHIIDTQRRFAYSNSRAGEIAGYHASEMLGLHISSFLTDAEWVKIQNRYEQVARGEKVPRQFETSIIMKTGGDVPIEVTTARTLWHGNPAELVIIRDISERKKSEKALRDSEERYRMLVENQKDLVIKLDAEGRFLFVSPSFCQMFGKSEDELVDTDSISVVHGEDTKAALLVRESLKTPPYSCYYEQRVVTNNGLRWLGWSKKAIIDEGSNELHSIVGIGRDITEQKRAEEEIQQLAYYDSLTNLPNRTLLHDRINQAIVQAYRSNHHVGVLFVDLDRFKSVNDTLGHFTGDMLLKSVASRLTGCMRESDTMARLGGDEFVVVLPSIEHAEDVTRVAEKLISQLMEPFQVGHNEIFTTGSIGISIFPGDGEDSSTLLKHADIAMYQAKVHGRNNFQFFSKEMNSKALEHLMLENSLRRALEREEFFLVYQPCMNLDNGTLSGMEALLRWRHPELGILSPTRFIALAEETGLILPIGEWVLRTACMQNKLWGKGGLLPLRVAVNLSARQFNQPNFVDRIKCILDETGLSPELLELELTESTVMTLAEETKTVLSRLKDMGISIAIDDFGTGYSSLSYLKHFPIDRLKIDRSFIREMALHSDDAAIVDAIIVMAHSLNLKVTAEGVENKDQLLFLSSRKCDDIQGYYLSMPLADDEFREFLRSGMMLQG